MHVNQLTEIVKIITKRETSIPVTAYRAHKAWKSRERSCKKDSCI